MENVRVYSLESLKQVDDYQLPSKIEWIKPVNVHHKKTAQSMQDKIDIIIGDMALTYMDIANEWILQGYKYIVLNDNVEVGELNGINIPDYNDRIWFKPKFNKKVEVWGYEDFMGKYHVHLNFEYFLF